MRRLVRDCCGVLGALLMMAGTAVGQDSFTPITGWDQQLFPSYLVATATARISHESESDEEADFVVLGDSQGVLGVELVSPGEELPVTVTVFGNAILEESSFEGTLDEEGTVYRIFPRIRYQYDALTRNKQSIPIETTFQVTVGDDDLGQQTVTLTLRSINDCPFAIALDDENSADISFMFAAYVNEQHPFVDKILREALDQNIVEAFTGYQSGDPAEVFRQVYALWNALSQRDVRYSNITTSAAASQAVASQHVRLIDESINNSQANCVDGSVLLASLLRKIDIESQLVYVPGHCYLAFFLDADRTQLVGLETTLIGSTGDEDAAGVPGLENVVGDDWRTQNSWLTFCAAVAVGNGDLESNQEKFNQDDPDYQVVSIAAARQMGILPIAFDSESQFESRAASEVADEEE